MQKLINKLAITLCLICTFVSIANAKSKVLSVSEREATFKAIAFHEQAEPVTIPEFTLIGKAYNKRQGHVVILKRVDTNTADFIDETVAVYHVFNDNVEILDFVVTFLEECGENYGSNLQRDLEYSMKKQLRAEIKNGNASYVEEFVGHIEALDDWSLSHFAQILEETEKHMTFEMLQNGKQEVFEGLVKKVRSLRSREVGLFQLSANDQREKVRQFALRWFMEEMKGQEDMDEGVIDGFTPRIKEEKLMDNGKLRITVEMTGGITGEAVGMEKTYIFDIDGQLMRS